MSNATFGPPPAPGIGLDALVGRESLRRDLADRVRGSRLPHALLLIGPRGVGKRTLAQALAAGVLCPAHGCGSCPDCGALLRGNHASYVEIRPPEGRSAIPIDAIQELARELSLRAPDERGRIVVLLGADRMTGPAQDALLKTLEEPPPGNVLVLTVVRADAVLPTIRSRCQRFALAPLRDEEVAEVARRLGIDARTPIAAAAGCPGALARLADERIARLRDGVAELMARPRGREDLARWIVLLGDGAQDDDSPAGQRARAALLLGFVESFARDAVVLRAAGGGDNVRNLDRTELLRSIAARPEWIEPLEALRRLARARDRIEGNVDPASALFCALDPAADEAGSAVEGP